MDDPTKWRITQRTHIETIRGQRIIHKRWWLTRPHGYPQSWVAECVGTYEQCRQAFIAVGKGQR